MIVRLRVRRLHFLAFFGEVRREDRSARGSETRKRVQYTGMGRNAVSSGFVGVVRPILAMAYAGAFRRAWRLDTQTWRQWLLIA